ncbi:MAG TPA: polysaccharide deacetylase family protein [Anaerohalosphaeraceae bacterium]|nr:polysaccharide deacetylase family protein [Anaerohalosphaeraceae bacterium]
MILLCYSLLFASFIVILYIPLPWLIGRILRFQQRTKVVNSKSIYLTFDDGPGNRLTPQILEILRINNIKATFFLLGRNINGKEELVKTLIQNDHSIASHSYSHYHAWRVLPWKAVRDIKQGWKVINNVLSLTNTKYSYRPPCGKMNILSLLYLLWHRTPIIFWTVDSLDTWPEEKRHVNYAAQRIKEDGGGIVLFHDFDRATNQSDDYVLESLDLVIKTAKEMKLKISVIEHL